MSDGIAAVQARVAQIQALISPQRASGGTVGTVADFQAALDAAAGTGSSTSTTGDVDLGAQVISTAKQYLGVPYRWGGTDPKTGLDCSGLTQLVYQQVGVDLPRTSQAQARTGTEVSSLANAKPGDLVFFGSPVHHVGIYLGNGTMLDAPKTGDKVRIRDVFETPSHIRRVLPETPSLATIGGGASAASVLGLRGTGSLSGTPYAAQFQAAGTRYGVDPTLLSAIAKAESGYRPNAVSHAGARGLMQLMPATARGLGVDPDSPNQAIDGAARLMADHLRTFNNRVDLALAAYNAGPGAVRKYGGVPPYDETQTYVRRVTGYWGNLR